MLILTLLLGCASNTGAPVAEPQPSNTDLKLHMQAHLSDVTAIWSAISSGDLAGAKAANAAFLEHKVAQDLPGDWLPRVGAMGEASSALSQATDLNGAARHAAALSVSCGDCHSGLGVRVQLQLPQAADGHPGSAAALRLVQHALISPKGVSWDDATASLAQAQMPDGGVASDWVAVAKAAKEATPTTRTAAAADVLAFCADCHSARTE